MFTDDTVYLGNSVQKWTTNLTSRSKNKVCLNSIIYVVLSCPYIELTYKLAKKIVWEMKTGL